MKLVANKMITAKEAKALTVKHAVNKSKTGKSHGIDGVLRNISDSIRERAKLGGHSWTFRMSYEKSRRLNLTENDIVDVAHKLESFGFTVVFRYGIDVEYLIRIYW